MNHNSRPWWARALHEERWELVVLGSICLVIILTAALTWP